MPVSKRALFTGAAMVGGLGLVAVARSKGSVLQLLPADPIPTGTFAKVYDQGSGTLQVMWTNQGPDPAGGYDWQLYDSLTGATVSLQLSRESLNKTLSDAVTSQVEPLTTVAVMNPDGSSFVTKGPYDWLTDLLLPSPLVQGDTVNITDPNGNYLADYVVQSQEFITQEIGYNVDVSQLGQSFQQLVLTRSQLIVVPASMFLSEPGQRLRVFLPGEQLYKEVTN